MHVTLSCCAYLHYELKLSICHFPTVDACIFTNGHQLLTSLAEPLCMVFSLYLKGDTSSFCDSECHCQLWVPSDVTF